MKGSLHSLLIKIIIRKDFSKRSKYSNYKTGQLAIESLCWKLHRLGDDVGSLMLADFLRSWGYSWVDKKIHIFTFHKEQYGRRLKRLLLKNNKDALESYFIGHLFATGAKIAKSLPLARAHFARSYIGGHPAGHHERLIAVLIDDDYNSKCTTLDLIGAYGIAKKDSITALSIYKSLTSLGSCIKANSDIIIELMHKWNGSIYSDYGKRYFNVKIEKAFKVYSDLAKNSPSNASFYVLGMIAGGSRINPTGKSCVEWYRKGALLGHIPCAINWIRELRDVESIWEAKLNLLETFGVLPNELLNEFKLPTDDECDDDIPFFQDDEF
jgi:hypothetical protein